MARKLPYTIGQFQHGHDRRTCGHKDCGVYLIAQEGGRHAIADTVEVPRSEGSHQASPDIRQRPQVGARRFICRGCYFIYEEARGLPQQADASGTPLAALPPDWRCPDCGSEKSMFHLHGAPAVAKGYIAGDLF